MNHEGMRGNFIFPFEVVFNRSLVVSLGVALLDSAFGGGAAS